MWKPLNDKLYGAGEFKDAPGVWKMDIATEGESGHCSVVRKLDGTWWYVTAMQGGIPGLRVSVQLGDQVTNPKAIAELEEQLALAKKKREESMNEGDRVRVVATGTVGTIKELWQPTRCSQDHQRCLRWRWRVQPHA